MRSFSTLALLALPLFGSVFAEPASSTHQTDTIYGSAQEAFQDLLNALPEESLQAALSGLKGFKDGVFESHHRGVEHVHENNPALATKLIVAAVHDLKKRQTPSNGTTTTPVAPPQSSPQSPQSSEAPPAQSSANNPPPAQSSANNPPPASTTTDRAVIVNVPQTTTNAQGQTVVQTTSVLSQVTASVAVTLVSTNSRGQAVTTTENRPAVIITTTDSSGRTTVQTSAARFAPTAGEVRTETDAKGSTFVTTYTPGGGKVSSLRLITTTGADGRPSVITSYTLVDPQATPTDAPANNPTQGSTAKPGLQNAAYKQRAYDYFAVGGAALAFFL